VISKIVFKVKGTKERQKKREGEMGREQIKARRRREKRQG
jgi:hypothetical protein